MTRLLALVVLAGGCLETLAPEVGPKLSGSGSAACPGDSNPAVAVHFGADLQRGVFDRGGCNTCHTGDGKGITQSGLDLSTYARLRTGGGRTGVDIVIDRDPCASYLVQEEIETAPPFGRRMPYNGPPYLVDADIQLVRDWITEGALDN